jgi:formylmethanofuran dehydrogenase subunit B
MLPDMPASQPPADDLARAAAALAAARRTLVTGLMNADAAVALAACDLAEAAGAAVDPGSPETARVAGPILARIGSVTAAPAELRDRADLVLVWFCDPERAAPGFVERFVAPPLDSQPRHTIVVGPRAEPPPAPARHLDLPAAAAIDTARLVEALIRGLPRGDAADPALASAADELAAAIGAATCVGIVTDWSADQLGLAAWSTAALVRALAHMKPAFEVPLGDRDDDAVAVCTWRYGAAGAIDRADRGGGRFRAAEGDAVRLIDRGEVDCVVVVGEPTAHVAAAIARAAGLCVVRLPADEAALRPLAARVAAAGAAP